MGRGRAQGLGIIMEVGMVREGIGGFGGEWAWCCNMELYKHFLA